MPRRPRQSAITPDKAPSPAAQFDDIAFLYDELMLGVPYAGWIDYVQRIFDRFNSHPRTILDLCCGTGSESLVLAEKGYEVTGVDISPGMIDIARRRAEERRVPIEYQVQDVTKLHLGRTFDAAISLFDSLNYILEAPLLQAAFNDIAEHLKPGGLLVFDMNTEYALAGGFFDQRSTSRRDAVQYKWTSSYDLATRICTINMAFQYHGNGEVREVTVSHFQRAYDIEEIVKMLAASGLAIEGVYECLLVRCS